MITSNEQAWLLHKRWSGDSSVRLSFFTLSQGLVHYLYKGGRKPQKQASLQLFTPLCLSLQTRREVSFLQQVEIAGSFLDLQGPALFSGLYLNELLYYLLKPADAHPELFAYYSQTLQALVAIKSKEELEIALRRFEIHFLQNLGHMASFAEEAQTGQDLNPETYYQFVPSQGFIAATQGIAGAHLLALQADNFSDKETRKAAKWILRKAIDYALEGRELKARALFASANTPPQKQ